MAVRGRVFRIFICLLLSFKGNCGFLDLEELKTVHYGISITNDPIVIGQEAPGAILLRSKYGQQYQCSYPDRRSEDEKARQEQQEALDTGITELLKPMADQACLLYPKDWWTYEFCYGKFVKQYHMENGKIVGNLIYLGYFESEFNWNNLTEQDKKPKYHSQTYTNGTMCDLTNRQRSVQIRFSCEEGSVDYVHGIAEAETCVYTMNVHTAKVCKHPYLKKPAVAAPIPITCNPLVTPQQYQDHLDAIQEQERIAQERTRAKVRSLLETSATGELEEVKEESSVEKLLRDTFGLKNPEDEGKENSHPLVSRDVKVKVFKDHKELRDYIKKMVIDKNVKGKAGQVLSDSEERKDENIEDGDIEGTGGTYDETKNLVGADEDGSKALHVAGDPEEHDQQGDTDVTDNHDDDDDDDGDEEDEHIIDDFTKQMNDIVDTEEKRVHMSKYTETLQSAMQAKFREILGEAQAELGDEVDVDGNQNLALKALSKTLKKIITKVAALKRLQKEKEMAKQQIDILAEKMRIKDSKETNGGGETSQSLTDETTRFDEHTDQAKKESPLIPSNEREELDTQTDSQLRDKTIEQGEYRSDDQNQHSEHTQTVLNEISEPNLPPEDDYETEQNIDAPANTQNVLPPQSTESSQNDDTSVEGQQTPESPSEVHNMDNRVRVRVTRIKHAPPSQLETGPKSVTGASDTLEMPEEQKRQLETKVKSELEKAGLDTEGQKIEVKIITAGYFDTDSKDGVHVLSEEESSAFNNMIVSILGGNNQAAKEMTKQRQMEESYSHVWGNSPGTKTASPTPLQSPPTDPPPQDLQDSHKPSDDPPQPSEDERPPPDEL